jgi:hypothetical protein
MWRSCLAVCQLSVSLSEENLRISDRFGIGVHPKFCGVSVCVCVCHIVLSRTSVSDIVNI